MSYKTTTIIDAVNLDDVDVLEEGVAPAPIVTILSQEGPSAPPPTPPPAPPDTTLAS